MSTESSRMSQMCCCPDSTATQALHRCLMQTTLRRRPTSVVDRRKRGSSILTNQGMRERTRRPVRRQVLRWDLQLARFSQRHVGQQQCGATEGLATVVLVDECPAHGGCPGAGKRRWWAHLHGHYGGTLRAVSFPMRDPGGVHVARKPGADRVRQQ